LDEVTIGDDGKARCRWGASTPEYRAYHDGEWGRPVAEEIRILEKLCLEGFQSGLSWITVLRKRDAFREVFDNFEPEAVARFGDKDVERLLGDARIIRHRGKINATITNARATLHLWDEGTTLAGLVWSYEPDRTGEPAPQALGDLPTTTDEAKALSKDLRKRGFAFVGPTTVYSAMQSLGLVNDHLEGCHWRAVAEKERRKFKRPGGR
jgi:DNA-3-methyladenine glycosylase I